MAEGRSAVLRLTLTILIVLNVAVMLYIALTPGADTDARTRIEALQINPSRIQVLGTANRGPAGAAVVTPREDSRAAAAACLEWGPFQSADSEKAASALAALALPEAAIQRTASGTAGGARYSYLVREPDAQAVARIAELQREFPGTSVRAIACPGPS